MEFVNVQNNMKLKMNLIVFVFIKTNTDAIFKKIMKKKLSIIKNH